MLKCSQLQDDAVAYAQGEVNESEIKAIQKHLAQCPACQKELVQVTQLFKLLGVTERIRPAAEVWSNLETRIKQNRDVLPKIRKSIPRTLRQFWWTRFTKGAVAAIILGLFIGGFIIVRGTKLIRSPHHQYVAEITRVTDKRNTIFTVGEDLPTTGPVEINKSLHIPQNSELVMNLISDSRGKQSPAGSLVLQGPARLEFKTNKHLKLYEGEAQINLTRSVPEWLLQTKNASVTTLGTKFTVKADEETTLVMVREGKVRFFSQSGVVVIESGYQSYARGNRRPIQPLPVNVLPLIQCVFHGGISITAPLIEIVPEKTVFNTGETTGLKWRITNQDNDLWFTPFLSGNSYLFLNVTNPQGKMLYVKFNPTRCNETVPSGFKQEAGLISFPKGASYEITCLMNEIFKETGQYQITGVYGAAPTGITNLKIWCGLLESEPVKIEVR